MAGNPSDRLYIQSDAVRLNSSIIMDRLCAEFPDMRRKGFRAAVRALFPGNEDVRFALTQFLPDGFCILHDKKEIHAIEVVDTSPIGFAKGQLYFTLGDTLIDLDWSLSVAAFNYTGQLICHLPFTYFGRIHTEKYAALDLRDVLPAAMAAAKDNGWYDRPTSDPPPPPESAH